MLQASNNVYYNCNGEDLVLSRFVEHHILICMCVILHADCNYMDDLVDSSDGNQV